MIVIRSLPTVATAALAFAAGIAVSRFGALVTVAPQVSVVSVGHRNRYGHPSPRVLGRLLASGTTLYRTDLDGTVTLVARPDGTFQVRRER